MLKYGARKNLVQICECIDCGRDKSNYKYRARAEAKKEIEQEMGRMKLTREEVRMIIEDNFKDQKCYKCSKGALDFTVDRFSFEITHNEFDEFSLKVFDNGNGETLRYQKILEYEASDVEDFVDRVLFLAESFKDPDMKWSIKSSDS